LRKTPRFEAGKLYADNVFRATKAAMFAKQDSTGCLELPSLNTVVERVKALEPRLAALEQRLSTRQPGSSTFTCELERLFRRPVVGDVCLPALDCSRPYRLDGRNGGVDGRRDRLARNSPIARVTRADPWRDLLTRNEDL
jgi:hypothetical protein